MTEKATYTKEKPSLLKFAMAWLKPTVAAIRSPIG
jgi:hypothetical protein